MLNYFWLNVSLQLLFLARLASPFRTEAPASLQSGVSVWWLKGRAAGRHAPIVKIDLG
jgi:hypothetical protein